MPTTFANTINGNEILAKRSQCDYAGNDIQTTYATKNELPTATSDLTNDSDFITSSDVPVKDVQVAGTSVVNAQGIAEISIPQTGVLDVEVDGSSVVNAQGVAEIALPTFTQVNADWDATSGASEILNKPDLSIYAESSDLATVATSGSYNDLLDKPSIPSAQVNADWDATSGVSEILHKPNLATVATTGDYSDLQNLPSIPAAQVNSDWNATSGVAAILNRPTLATVATTGAYSDLSGTPTIPSYTAGDGVDITNNIVSAKVDGTTVSTNASGELTVIGGGGGGSQVNSDWDATSGVAEILNKPTPKTLTAGTGISITDGVNTVTISSTVTPTVDQTYNANSTSAQSGVAVADAIGNLGTNLSAAQLLALKGALGVDETVLWQESTPSSTMITLSETSENFERIKIFYRIDDLIYGSTEVLVMGGSQKIGMSVGGNYVLSFAAKWGIYILNGTSLYPNVVNSAREYNNNSNGGAVYVQYENANAFYILKVVGIHRIASN